MERALGLVAFKNSLFVQCRDRDAERNTASSSDGFENCAWGVIEKETEYE